ncbi:glycosyltransferase family 61 protein [Caulobacter sp.]|uniref:glycosyltransferase family 61 protein n=1 Tax=Caulobacter sp. TaxID=78 RepID=UPI003BAA4738
MTFDAPLHVLDNAVLPAVADEATLLARLRDGGPAAMAWRTTDDAAASDGDALLAGKAAERWPFERSAPPIGVSALCLARDVLHFPAFGVVVERDGPLKGGVHQGPSGEALHRWPDLAGLPGVRVEAYGPRLVLRDDPPVIARGALFQPWGGGFNYGHFVLDALPSLLMLDEAGLLDDAEILSPVLKPWQRDLLALAFPKRAIRELSAPVVRVESALYATSMNHFLHAPDATVARVAQRVLAASKPMGQGPRRVYLSRRWQSMRVMVNERALEKALKQRGFVVVRPERLSARQQVELMRDAEVVVAPTGAAVANALFMPAGARMIEIQPENFTSRWAWAACRQVGVDWRGYVCDSPADARKAGLARLRRGFRFAYEPPLDDLLAFIDAAL